MKRLVILSDTHCGHKVGLTPPKFNPTTDEFTRTRTSLWNWFSKEIKDLSPIDLLVFNGDAIDGTGHRSGGVEQLTTDRAVQVDMAEEIVRLVGAKKNYFVTGTGYHTGDAEDWELQLAKRFNSELYNKLPLDVNGLKLDFRHHTSSSNSLTARNGGAIKEARLMIFESVVGEGIKADIVVRSHVHYHTMTKDYLGTVVTTPALQYKGSKYGELRCSGHVDFGFLALDIEDKYNYQWIEKIASTKSLQATKLVVA